jgi:hypothetical protein
MAFRSALTRGAAGFGLLLLSIAPSACASSGSRAATPPQTANANPAQSTGAKAPTTLSMIGTGDTPAAPSPSPDALPALPSPAPAPAIPPATTPGDATAATAPAATTAAPLPPLAVNINDELPFLAIAATPSHATHSKTADDETKKKPHTKKLPPGPTGQHTTTRHGRKRGTSSRPYHPDPGVVVDITSAAAGANQAEVQKLARSKGYNPFRHCYEEGLRRNQHLAGKVSVEFTLGAEGAVVGAKKASSSLADESVNQCVVREASKLVLAKPDSGTPAIAMAITLSPGDEPVPVPHAAPHADKLRDALRAKWSGVEVCYKQGLDKRRDLGGRMELKFKVKGSGEILESTEGDVKFGDAAVTQCVLGVYKSAKLPKVTTSSKKETTFVYAIHLESVPQAPVAASAPAPAAAPVPAPTPVATTQP